MAVHTFIPVSIHILGCRSKDNNAVAINFRCFSFLFSFTTTFVADCLGQDMPGSMHMVNSSLTIPSNPYMTDAEVETVVKVVDKVWKKQNI